MVHSRRELRSMALKHGNSNILRLRILIAVMTLLLSTVTFAGAAAVASEEVSLTDLANFITLATSYLVRVSHTKEQDPRNEGKFTYIAYLGEDLPLDFTSRKQKEYNLLRHNGAIYSLSLSYTRKKDEAVLAAMQRSIGYLKREAISPVPDVSDTEISDDGKISEVPIIPNLLAAWETKAITGDSGSVKAKLGGAGLALIALVSLEEITPGVSDLNYLRQIGEFIKFLQHDNGSFTCRYIPTEGGKEDEWTSLYYPGEAALGLVYLATIETDASYRQRWITVATKALMYLESLRRTQDLSEIEPDHWALLSTQRLLPLLDPSSKEYWLVYDHGVRVVKSMLAGHSKKDLKDKNKGCFTGDERTCPTATRLEGLTASLSFVRDSEMFVSEYEDKAERLIDRMRHDIRLGIQFLIESQETDDSHNMHGGVPVIFPAENHHSREVRVDYVQHSMSAMIAYETLLLSEKHRKRLGFGISMPDKPKVLDEGFPSWYLLVVFTVALTGVAVFSSKKKEKGNKNV
ncbi:hypothetical protein MHU86_18417 [Fragilaria crotonensis]|nr:hypothetical protein MHU86_18417 [Fragilaria crotonensis]